MPPMLKRFPVVSKNFHYVLGLPRRRQLSIQSYGKVMTFFSPTSCRHSEKICISPPNRFTLRAL